MAAETESNIITCLIRPGQGYLTVRAFAEGLFSAFGHNPKLNANVFSGELKFQPEHFESASLRFSVKGDSLRVTDNVGDTDRREIERTMKEEVLQVAKYPDIVFASKAVTADRISEGFYRVKVNGQLSLHGVTRDHAVEAQVRLLENGLRAEGKSLVRQSDYGIKRVSVAGGMLKVKDEVKISFAVTAEKVELDAADVPNHGLATAT
jgi:polyisoprenoid-binding protein YceI